MHPRPLHLAACALMLFAAPALHAQSTNDRVRIEVKAKTDNDRKDIKNATADTITQSKTFEITISGKAKSPETRTGTWTAYGRDLKDRQVITIESGEFKIELPATGTQKVETKTVTSTYTNAHTITKAAGRGRTNAKRVDAEGTKHAGIAVVVKDGDKVVGEFYDPAGLKAEAEKK